MSGTASLPCTKIMSTIGYCRGCGVSLVPGGIAPIPSKAGPSELPFSSLRYSTHVYDSSRISRVQCSSSHVSFLMNVYSATLAAQ